jgi:hypothetical protein
MAQDRAARVTVTIMGMIDTARGGEFRQHIEDLLREEFHSECHESVADRGDADLTQEEADRIDDYIVRGFEDDGDVPDDFREHRDGDVPDGFQEHRDGDAPDCCLQKNSTTPDPLEQPVENSRASVVEGGQLDFFLMSLPPCRRGGPCEAVTEFSASGTVLRCVTCDCVAPLTRGAPGTRTRQ